MQGCELTDCEEAFSSGPSSLPPLEVLCTNLAAAQVAAENTARLQHGLERKDRLGRVL